MSLHIAGATHIGKLFYGTAGPFHCATPIPSSTKVYTVDFAYGLDVTRQPSDSTGITRCVRP